MPAAPDAAPRRSTVLFVHGAHLESWCWLLVMDRLAAQGIASHSVDLPFTGYDDDVRCVRSTVATLREQGRAVHIVCHSYSGLPVAAAGHGATHLTFVAGRLPLPGESAAAATDEWNFPDFRACMRLGDDGLVRLAPAASPLMYNRTAPPLADLAMARARTMRSTVPDAPLADPAWRTVPSSYVVCSEDRAVRPDAQRERAALIDEAVELQADHSPFFSAPGALAEFVASRHRAMVSA